MLILWFIVCAGFFTMFGFMLAVMCVVSEWGDDKSWELQARMNEELLEIKDAEIRKLIQEVSRWKTVVRMYDRDSD